MRPAMYQVVPQDDFSAVVYYDNGEIKRYDCGWMLREAGVFEPLHDVGTFMETCCILNGTLAFDVTRTLDPTACVDICPDTVYEESVAVADVLSA